MNDILSDLTSSKYKIKNASNVAVGTENSKGDLLSDLTSGTYKLKTANDNSKTSSNFTQEDVARRLKVSQERDANKANIQQIIKQGFEQEQEEKKQEQERWDNLSIPEKIVDPFKTTGANIKYGDLGIKESQAWGEYRSKQDEETLNKAQQATKEREEYEANNERVGKGNAFTKDFAQYLPQMGGQLGAGLSNAAGGAVTGAGVGATTALVAGQLGPQIAVPEEIATVPAGIVTGATWGGRAGYVAGTAKYSYDLMAGSAYKTLLDMGVPNDIALELSGNEALINSLIEGVGSVADLASFGTSTVGKNIIKSKLLAALKAYGINLISEPIEEMAQEKVSIETEKEAAKRAGIERESTEAQDAERIKGSGLSALKISAISGGGNAGINFATNTVKTNLNTNKDTRKLKSIDSKTLTQLNDIDKNVAKNEQTQLKGVGNLIPQKNVVSQSPTTKLQGPVQQTSRTEGKMAQNGGMEQMVKNSSKLANDVQELGKNLNIPTEFVEIDDKTIEGYEKDGRIYINKNAEKPYNRIFKHELTHYLEQNGVSYNELSNEIMNSNAFANQLEDLGMNLDEYRQKIINRYAEKGINLTEEDANREIISKFVEEKMFNDEKSVRRLAEQNPGLIQKVKNWIDDMLVKFRGTAEEKELLRMQKMYKEALSQVNNTNQATDAQYSIAGIRGAKRLRKNPSYSNIIEQYKNAKKLYKEGYDNAKLIEETGWYRDNKGNWKYEFSDEDMTLKKNIKLDDKKMYALDKMLEHDVLFEAYPQLKNYTVIFANIGDGNRAGIYSPAKIILLNPKYANTKATVEYELAHEIQHAIQVIERFPGSTSKKKGGYAYYSSLGEIEARDVSERLRMLQNERKQFMPETANENPVHEGLERYLQNRTEDQRIQDEEYIQKQEAKEKIKESIKSFFEKGGIGYDQDIEMDNNQNNTETQSETNRVLHNKNTENKRVAGKEPAFSLPETDNQGRKLSAEQQEFFKDSKVRDDEGRLKPVYHGTKRADRVGYYFDPAKATSGPMAFFTDDVEIATNYSKSKQDTSISREADTEYDLFKVNGKDLDSYWDSLSPKQKRDIAEKGNNIGFDEDWENVVYGKNASEESFGDQYKWRLNREYNGNAIKALYGIWIEDGNLMFEDIAKFKDILNMAGIENVEYLDKFKEEPKVYEVYMNLKNPFVTSDINQEIINKLQKASENATIGEQYTADSWDKSNIEPKDWMSMLRDDIKNNTTHSWTIIPDWVTDVLKSEGYDGIQDTGGKYSGLQHNVYIPFYSNQIKETSNTNPTENADIRYSIDDKEDNTSNARALSRYAQTLQKKHKDIPEHVNLIQKEIDNGNFMHEVIRDKRSLNYAEKYIEENGFEDAVNHWDELIKRGKPVDKDELALGQMIYNLAVENKDTKLVMKMASDLVQEYTEIGRNLQSATLLRKMTPDGRLYSLERSVQKINQDLMQKFDDFENIQIPEALADELLRSETQKQMDDAVEKIQIYIANQIPATWQERLNSWRYLSMLGNPRTHIRNIIGNAVFIPAVEVKNVIAQAGEKFIPQEQRTKAILSKKDDALVKYAENDFDKNKEIIRGENKYDIKAGIQEKRTIYSTKALEAARKGNFNLLEAEDTLFLKFRYKRAFAQALKARGMTIEQLRENSPETVRKVNEIRSYAINEAQKATYRDASVVASMISRGKRKLLNVANQSSGVAKLGYNLAYLGVEGVVPFAKTPINIIKRGIEYSPAGLLNGIKDAAFNVKNGKVTAAQAIDKIAAGTTGTAIVGLGYLLASLGLVSGGEEEKDKEQALKELKGYQNYSLNLFGKSYTIDWTAPSSIPLFIGVEIYNSIKSGDESAWLKALANVAEPVVEMSMLQGLNSTLTTMGEDNALGNVIGKTLTNYLGQYNPTILGQIARSIDKKRRTTYVDKNIPIPAAVQRFIQQQAAKTPGASMLLPTYKDQFGQEQITDNVIDRVVQNFLSPGYVKDIKEGTVEKGITELYEKTGETSVIPSYASKTLTQDKEKINLTAKEYDTYAKTRGELSMKGLEGVFKDKAYQNLTDKQKVDVVKGIYDYANDVAKSKVLKGFELEGNNKKAQELDNKGLDFYKFVMIKKTADTDGNGYTSNAELDKAISKYGATRWKGLIKKKEK